MNILGRERPILVEIAGARGGQAGNMAHLFDQVRASQPRFKHVEHGEMDPSQSGHRGPMFKRGGERMFPGAGRRCSAVLSGVRRYD